MKLEHEVSWTENPDGSVTFIINGQSKTLPNDELLPIRIGLFQLQQLQKIGKGHSDLAWEIRVYQWILNHPQSRLMAEQYKAVRKLRTHTPPNLTPKRELVKILGWEIP